RAEEPGDGSVGDREAQSFNNGHLAVALRETVDLDHARPPWDRLAESGWPSRPPVRRRSSTGDAAATTAATTRAPSARPESTSWTKWTPAATRGAAIASEKGTANRARRGTKRMKSVEKGAARTARFDGYDQSPLLEQLSTVAVSETLQGRGSSTSSLTASLTP